jgi:hypothetical protein
MHSSSLKSRILTAMPAGLSGPGASRTIRRVVWTLALVSLLVWSLLAYGTHALLVGGAAFLQTQTEWLGANAWLQPWLESGIGLTEGISVAITWIVWGVGAFLILLGAWLLPKAFSLFGGAPAR